MLLSDLLDTLPIKLSLDILTNFDFIYTQFLVLKDFKRSFHTFN